MKDEDEYFFGKGTGFGCGSSNGKSDISIGGNLDGSGFGGGNACGYMFQFGCAGVISVTDWSDND